MFADFNSLMNFSEKSPPKSKFVLVSDAQNDASFIIHHFLSMYIKGGLRVIFLALVQSFSHYNNVAQKLGVNLSNAVQNGQVIYLDGLKLISEALDEGNQEKSLDNQQTSNEGDNPFVNIRNPNFSLQPLYNKIKSFATAEQNPLLLLIDDLSSLISIGVRVQEIIDFTHYCSTLMCFSPTVVDGCLVTLVHNDSDAEDEESLLLWRQLCHEAHVELHVRGLKSGYCKDVHGQLTITQRDENRMKHRTREVQFKILEKNVTFFAPGMSKAVL
ncbi:elongator complex protein 6-like isoform X2 [Acropora muricata]|uniref:elongator complex protein 6-like isoform X2 n=1 Tax=Acropora muricata TaxID=159855 RepID=UPI0034E37650